ncbi:MAG: hypothetical protein ACYC27_07740 [Armatimonadota bacterium]
MSNRLGMYVHMHWGYSHPYAARTWTMDDWRGYAQGLSALGYNMIMIWPMFETMPEPLTPSDKAHLIKIRNVIDLLHSDFGMRVLITLGPNTIGNEKAGDYTFETRPFFSSDLRLNPGSKDDMDRLMLVRRTLFEYLPNSDGYVIIDSDPGGYIGSTNEEFTNLLWRHLDVIKEYNPKAMLFYWMHVGWETYNRMWQKIQEEKGPIDLQFTVKDYEEVIAGLMKRPNENWAVTSGMPVHQEAIAKFGVQDRTMFFPYGVVEGEPTFPLTNYYPDWEGEMLKRYNPCDMQQGAMANAQTHVVQLPATYMYSHFINGGTLEDMDLVGFADGLIPGIGQLIADSWVSMYSGDTAKMRELASNVDGKVDARYEQGPYSGLLFGSAKRFLEDLAMQLRYRAASVDLINIMESEGDWKPILKDLHTTWSAWQKRTGFVDAYGDVQGIHAALRKLEDPGINAVLFDFEDWSNPSVRHGILIRLLDAIGAKASS